MSRVVHFKFENGERYPTLVDENGIPDFWITLFVTSSLRTSHTASSIENIVRDILHIRLWEKIEKRSLEQEFKQAGLLTDDDISSIRDHCRLDARALKKYLAGNCEPRVSRIKTQYATNVKSFKTVGRSHFTNRISHIAEYLSFLARNILRKRSNFSELHWPILKKTNSPIWNSLFLIRDKEFHADFPPKEFSWVAYFGESDRSFRFYPITFSSSSSFSSLPVLP